jgi:hypothetical protein
VDTWFNPTTLEAGYPSWICTERYSWGIGKTVAVYQRGVSPASDGEEESVGKPIRPLISLKVTGSEHILSLFFFVKITFPPTFGTVSELE